MAEARVLPAVRLASILFQWPRGTKPLHIGAPFELSERSRGSRHAQGSRRVGFQTADHVHTSSVDHAARASSVGESYFLWAIEWFNESLIPARTAHASPDHRRAT